MNIVLTTYETLRSESDDQDSPFRKKWLRIVLDEAKPVEANQSGSHQKLERLIKATCLRRTKKALAGSLDLLPPIEEIEYVELHTEDQELYDFFKMKTASIAANMKSKKRGKTDKGESILPLMNFLRLICNEEVPKYMQDLQQ
ncbi:hypothetical protein MGN70_008792 [Eutypa lata]|nr:hypothetical protein MGN70_008792 [Eutypa lata]